MYYVENKYFKDNFFKFYRLLLLKPYFSKLKLKNWTLNQEKGPFLIYILRRCTVLKLDSILQYLNLIFSMFILLYYTVEYFQL
jgi:hypothetical protein